MKKFLALLSLTAIVLLTPITSEAGAVYNGYFLTKNADGSGFAGGTFNTWRASPNPSDYAKFQMEALTLGTTFAATFAASLGGVSASCVTNAAGMLAAWPAATASRGYFYITWNASGNCLDLQIINGSHVYY